MGGMGAPGTLSRGETGGGAGRWGRLPAALRNLAVWICLSAGGVLWALTPLGVHLSELKFKTPNVFWKLFPSAPLLLALALVAFYFGGNATGRLGKLGVWITLLGILLVVAGDAGLFYLHLDERYLGGAPAWRTFRVGLVLLSAGAWLFGLSAARERSVPLWGALPFAACSAGGLFAVLGDRGALGATLWMTFGLGWTWLGISLFAKSALGFREARASGHEHSTLSEDKS